MAQLWTDLKSLIPITKQFQNTQLVSCEHYSNCSTVCLLVSQWSMSASHNESMSASHNESTSASHKESTSASHKESMSASHNESLSASHNECL